MQYIHIFYIFRDDQSYIFLDSFRSNVEKCIHILLAERETIHIRIYRKQFRLYTFIKRYTDMCITETTTLASPRILLENFIY